MVFNTALLVTHFLLITSNMSTVEDLGARRMRERENRVLSRLHKPWHFRYVIPLAPSVCLRTVSLKTTDAG